MELNEVYLELKLSLESIDKSFCLGVDRIDRVLNFEGKRLAGDSASEKENTEIRDAVHLQL